MKIKYFIDEEKINLVSIETRSVLITQRDAVATESVEVELPPMAEVGFDGGAFVVKFESVVNDRSYEEQNFCGTLERQHTRTVRLRSHMREDEFAGAIKALEAIAEEAKAEHAAFTAIALAKNQ
ncbi:MAG: hypothetical protein HGB34_00175 [Candidatus Moranbacteria bacterium]|nr:hypothetical protein [Candidatus Moranbacteria bacterium]NTW75311.1 hypothetical protein [Candidatus Moranbacteria bacterium]